MKRVACLVLLMTVVPTGVSLGFGIDLTIGGSQPAPNWAPASFYADVSVTNTGASGVDVAGFSFAVTASASDSGTITFVDSRGDRNEGDPSGYIFGTHALAATAATDYSNLSSTSDAPLCLTAADFTDIDTPYVTIAPGVTVLLGRVYFNHDGSGSSVTLALKLAETGAVDQSLTNLIDENSNQTGTITADGEISGLYHLEPYPVTSVPEPMTVLTAAQALACVLGIRAAGRRFRRAV